MKKLLACALSAALSLSAADLPVTRVVLYKNGVAYFERGGEVPAGEAARLDFKASEMNDVLKSLIIEDRTGGIRQVRYELNEPLEKKLADIGIQLPPEQSLALLLDQWRGARIDLRYRGQNLKGSILGGRLSPLPQGGQRQELNLLLDSGELAMVLLDETTGLKLEDARMQQQLKDALLAMSQSRSTERRSVFIDSASQSARKLAASYLAPAPVWKSSYRLTLLETGDPTLEGWAVIDNDSGADWTNVNLTVVSGKPVSFISQLYDPRYVQRQIAGLPEDHYVAPVVYEGTMAEVREQKAEALADAAAPQMLHLKGGSFNRTDGTRLGSGMAPAGRGGGFAPAAAAAPMMTATVSSVAPAATGQEVGDLFEYQFANPVTARKGESLLLPFVQQKITAKKLLVYSDRSSAHPRAAAEITNSTGKTLDGGPITVYQGGSYAGEALIETLKAGDKRLVSYALDLGTRITTNFESGSQTVRKVTANRGILTTSTAIENKTTYTIANVDAKAKTLVVEHPVTPGLKLVSPKADETTSNRHRFNVALAVNGSAKLTVVEEREIQSSTQVISMTPDMLGVFVQNKVLSAAARQQLEAIAAKKGEIASADSDLRAVSNEMQEITRDQDRIRQNLNSLNRVAGQQEQIQRYVGELAQGDAQLAKLRDRQAQLQKRRAALEAELNALIEKLAF